MDEIPTGDTTAAAAATQQAAETLVRSLPSEYKKVAKLEVMGYTRAEMRARGMPDHLITNARARIKQLRRLLPDEYEYRRVLRTPPARGSDDVSDGLSDIDRELEQLEFAPPAGKDCPPCWRCKWFEGYLPGDHIPTRMEIAEPDVSAAVKATEAEKIRIANEVRNGIL